MDPKIKELLVDLEKTRNQISNLDTVLENIHTTDIDIKPHVLNNLYNNIKILSIEARNEIISDLSKFSGPSNKTHKFSTMRDDQRIFLLEKLKERYAEKKAFIESFKQD